MYSKLCQEIRNDVQEMNQGIAELRIAKQGKFDPRCCLLHKVMCLLMDVVQR